VSSNVVALRRRRSAGPTSASAPEEAQAVSSRPDQAGPADPTLRPDLEAVFRAEYRGVVAAARRVVTSQAEAEDVAQEVFLSFGRSAVPRENARGWLYVAAAHTALNQLRADRRRDAREQRAASPEPDVVVPDTADTVSRQLERDLLRAALGRLPRQQATVLVLRHSGLSYAEIAAHTDLSPGSVGTTLRRAEAALRQEMSNAPQ
jgi:RNA polymerase sigma factor (sigma-70 family)